MAIFGQIIIPVKAICDRTHGYTKLSIIERLTFGTLLKTNITTTNPGPALFNLKEAGDAEILEFINFPQITPPAQLGIIYTTYQNELRILTLYDDNQWDEAQISSLVDLLWSEVLMLASESDVLPDSVSQ